MRYRENSSLQIGDEPNRYLENTPPSRVITLTAMQVIDMKTKNADIFLRRL